MVGERDGYRGTHRPRAPPDGYPHSEKYYACAEPIEHIEADYVRTLAPFRTKFKGGYTHDVKFLET